RYGYRTMRAGAVTAFCAAIVMLTYMACESSNPAPPPGAGQGEVIKVPGGRGAAAGGPQIGGAGAPEGANPNGFELSIAKPTGAANTAIMSEVRVVPAPGYHVNLDFPTSLTLDAAAGDMQLTRTSWKQTDVDTLTEKELKIKVGATIAKPGT